MWQARSCPKPFGKPGAAPKRLDSGRCHVAGCSNTWPAVLYKQHCPERSLCGGHGTNLHQNSACMHYTTSCVHFKRSKAPPTTHNFEDKLSSSLQNRNLTISSPPRRLDRWLGSRAAFTSLEQWMQHNPCTLTHIKATLFTAQEARLLRTTALQSEPAAVHCSAC